MLCVKKRWKQNCFALCWLLMCSNIGKKLTKYLQKSSWDQIIWHGLCHFCKLLDWLILLEFLSIWVLTVNCACFGRLHCYILSDILVHLNVLQVRDCPWAAFYVVSMFLSNWNLFWQKKIKFTIWSTMTATYYVNESNSNLLVVYISPHLLTPGCA